MFKTFYSSIYSQSRKLLSVEVKRDPEATRAAPEVQEELTKAGVNAEAQAVRNALNYLQGRSVLRRVGYGKYQLEDGRIIDGLP